MVFLIQAHASSVVSKEGEKSPVAESTASVSELLQKGRERGERGWAGKNMGRGVSKASVSAAQKL